MFFFPQLCDNHPEDNLAEFNYKQNMKIKVS
jgi:hypothetical protein